MTATHPPPSYTPLLCVIVLDGIPLRFENYLQDVRLQRARYVDFEHRMCVNTCISALRRQTLAKKDTQMTYAYVRVIKGKLAVI